MERSGSTTNESISSNCSNNSNGASIPAQQISLPPHDGTSSAEKLIARLTTIHRGLSEVYPNIQPGEVTNKLFSELVSLCILPFDTATCDAVLSDKRLGSMVPDLRKYASEGEGMLEEYWARRILDSPDHEIEASIALLRQFPYYQNYVDLARLELSAITSVYTPTKQPPRSFAFLGSGPMPLTAICLAQLLDPVSIHHGTAPDAYTDHKTAVQIHNIDRNPIAIELSSKLCSVLGRLTRALTFECADANSEASSDLKSFDVVYLAALVGITPEEKLALVASVAARMRTGAMLVMRSAHSMRRILYPTVDPAGLAGVTGEQGLKVVPILVVHPWNEVVNSVIIARVDRADGQ
ncbi:Nicotianamine synthase [Kalaharituber pfeilii]|nr:Nicotianamine synthase [Kalaharituber pfeilii]